MLRIETSYLPNLEYDLAARVSTSDSFQGFAHLLEWQYRLDLGAQPALVDQPTDRVQPLPVDVGVERLAGDAPSQLVGSTDEEDRPAALAHRADGLIAGMAASSVEEDVDAAGNHGEHLLDPVAGVVVEHFAGTQVPQVVALARAGHAQRARAHGPGDLHGGAAHAPGRGGDEHGLTGLQLPPDDQSVPGGPSADHQPGRLLEAQPFGHAPQAVHVCQRVLGKPAAGHPQLAHPRSPGRTSTPSPTASTTPATSNPGM